MCFGEQTVVSLCVGGPRKEQQPLNQQQQLDGFLLSALDNLITLEDLDGDFFPLDEECTPQQQQEQQLQQQLQQQFSPSPVSPVAPSPCVEQPVLVSSFFAPYSEFPQPSEFLSPKDINPVDFAVSFHAFESQEQDGSFSQSPSSSGQTVPVTTGLPSYDTFNSFPCQQQGQQQQNMKSKKRKANIVAEEDQSEDLSKEQEKILKNRESAQQSRKRKRTYLAQLETDFADLKSNSETMKQKVSTLATENQLLKDQLRDLREVIAQATQFSMLLSGHPQQQQLIYQQTLPQQQ